MLDSTGYVVINPYSQYVCGEGPYGNGILKCIYSTRHVYKRRACGQVYDLKETCHDRSCKAPTNSVLEIDLGWCAKLLLKIELNFLLKMGLRPIRPIPIQICS